jgi:methionyl-tRNA formyltransferase
MRIGFVSCVRLGLSCMQAIYEVGGELSFAMTLRDDLAREKSGRVYLDDFCATNDVPLHKVGNINEPDALTAIRSASLDWLFVVGWSQIIGSDVLDAVRRGVLGMHPTMLPTGRGRAPIPWAILLGLPQTGVTLFKMDQGVDSGPIVAQLRVAIEPRETAATLYDKVGQAHAELLRLHWDQINADQLTLTPQDESLATVWARRKPEDGLITPDFRVEEVDRLIRAVTRPYPGAFIETPQGRLILWASGAPNEDMGGGIGGSGLKRLFFRDGWLDITDASLGSGR